MKSEEKKSYFGDRTKLLICCILFGLYFVNVFLGKASIRFGWKVYHLGNVGEFLLLLLATAFLVVVALHREKLEAMHSKTQNKEEG